MENLDEEELRAELMQLFDRFEPVRIHYKMDLGSEKDRQKIYEKAKKEIVKKFATRSYRRPRRPRVKAINAILRELAKNAVFQHSMIDVYLHTVESAVHFMNEYDYYSDPLNNVVINSYGKACTLIIETALKEEFEERCTEILQKLRFYYGLRMTLRRSFLEVYPEKKSTD